MVTNYNLFKEAYENINDSGLLDMLNRLVSLRASLTEAKKIDNINRGELEETLKKINARAITIDGVLLRVQDTIKGGTFSGSIARDIASGKYKLDSADKKIAHIERDIRELVVKHKEIITQLAEDITPKKGLVKGLRDVKKRKTDRDANVGDIVMKGKLEEVDEAFGGIRKFVQRVINWGKRFFNRFDRHLDEFVVAMNELGMNIQVNENRINENVNNEITKWIGRSKQKRRIIELLTSVAKPTYSIINGDIDSAGNVIKYIQELRAMNVIYREQSDTDGRVFVYKVTERNKRLFEDAGFPIVTQNLTNKSETVDATKYDYSYLPEVLEAGRRKIDSYFNIKELEKQIEDLTNLIIPILEEKEALEVVLEDKVIKLVNNARANLDSDTMLEQINKLDNIDKQTKREFDLITKTIVTEVSKSTRLDTLSDPDGDTGELDREVGYRFESKKINEKNVFKKLGNWFRNLFRRFKNFVSKVEKQLDTIG